MPTSPRADALPVETAPGLRVLVTRPADQAQGWAAALQAQGIEALPLPLIGIAPAVDTAALDRAWQRLSHWSLLVFVSPNAATQFFARRPAGLAWPEQVTVASPGPGTSAQLRTLGVPGSQLIEPASTAAQFDSEALWAQLQAHAWAGQAVLIVRGDGGRAWLGERLAEAGATVDFLAAYRRGGPLLDAAQRRWLDEALAAPQRHLWLLSSSEALDHLPALAHCDPAALVLRLASAASLATHPRIAERAQAAGFGTVLSCRPELAAVVACIQSWSRATPPSAPHAAT